MGLSVDGISVKYRDGDSALVAMLRANLHPTGGGCLCLAGDCSHCLATVDGVSFVRTCQVRAEQEMVVECDHAEGRRPPLLRNRAADATSPQRTTVQHLHCDVVVIGMGDSGAAEAAKARENGLDVVTLDAAAGQEAIGIYQGPLVVARTSAGMLHVNPRVEIVVATGAAEIQPIVPGSDLSGLVTARAAAGLHERGIELGRVVAVGEAPAGVEVLAAGGELVRLEGEARVQAVVVRTADGEERRLECDTVSLGLGWNPRDTLMRMGRDLPVRVVGSASMAPDLPACPAQGTVCPCNGVTVDDLSRVWEHGFQELELVKRGTTAGTGTCQGATCTPYIRRFLLDRGKQLQAPFTARPVTRQLTFDEVAAGCYDRATPRTALDAEHRSLGATMERAGGWWRPWTYHRPQEEFRAVREAVSICDVSTLGKVQVSGPDALAFLEHVYPTRVSTIKPGSSRYVLVLDEKGYVLDDGLVCRDEETRFTLSFTSGGSTMAELWTRDWAESLDFDVRLLNQTMSLGAINVTGPLAGELLYRAGAEELPGFMRHGTTRVAGIDCRIFRLSFTGELSYELHHCASESVELWRRLLELGKELGIQPHGLETLLKLRLEKGHIVVGQDTDYDSTPRRIDHEWAVHMDKPDFVGKQAILRTDKVELDRQLVGLEMESPAPIEGAVIWNGSDYAGYVTSSTDSPTRGKAVMLGWLRHFEGELPEDVTIAGRAARRVPTPFYDPKGSRARTMVPPRPDAGNKRGNKRLNNASTGQLATSARSSVEELSRSRVNQLLGGSRLQRIACTRVVSTPAALDALVAEIGSSGNTLALRLAPDELLVTSSVARKRVQDSHAIVLEDAGFAGAWLAVDEAERFLSRACEWPLPTTRPAFAQGAVADLPVKLWFEEDRVLFLVPAPFASTLEARMR